MYTYTYYKKILNCKLLLEFGGQTFIATVYTMVL
jgi:hypothetical protein